MAESPDDAPDPDEPDFAKHLRNVLDDVRYHMVDVDEAERAILEHPALEALHLKPIGTLRNRRDAQAGDA